MMGDLQNAAAEFFGIDCGSGIGIHDFEEFLSIPLGDTHGSMVEMRIQPERCGVELGLDCAAYAGNPNHPFGQFIGRDFNQDCLVSPSLQEHFSHERILPTDSMPLNMWLKFQGFVQQCFQIVQVPQDCLQ
jgi:hypothetical protein